jgi:hypothetical protein
MKSSELTRLSRILTVGTSSDLGPLLLQADMLDVVDVSDALVASLKMQHIAPKAGCLRTFGPKGELINEELRNLKCSPNIIRKIKSRRVRWVKHVACTWEKRNARRVLV